MWKFVVCCFFVFLMTVSAGSAMAASKIAFSGLVGVAPAQIYVMDPDGTSLLNISNNPYFDSDPSWSPDGTRIAFFSNRDAGAWDVYSMRPDGSDVIRITSNGFVDRQPISWSPELPASVASISPFGQFVIVFLLGGASALWMTRRQHAASPLTTT